MINFKFIELLIDNKIQARTVNIIIILDVLVLNFLIQRSFKSFIRNFLSPKLLIMTINNIIGKGYGKKIGAAKIRAISISKIMNKIISKK